MKNILKIIIVLLITVCSAQNNQFPGEDIIATTAYLGEFGRVSITIDDANGDRVITQPLIVAEGFDVGVVIAPENENGYQDYEDFRTFVANSNSNALRNLIWDTAKDYDIIYVDWDNGVDYMQRNAYALQEVIAWVNQEKADAGSTEPNVVLGQSMGGVIARWALADMEERGLDHDTRLFISHDAPQQGANVPVSLQYMYRHGGNQYAQTGQTLGGAILTVPVLEITVGVSNYLSLLDAPATKQLLKERATSSYVMENTEHDNFYNGLRNKGLSGSNGYPINCRNIALSNGSECGNTQNFSPGDFLVEYRYNKGLSFWGDLASLVYNPIGGLIGGFYVDNDLFGVAALGLVPGNSRYRVTFEARAIPYGSNQEIYHGNISYVKRILWVGPKIVVDITDVRKDQPLGVLPLDTYGGGYFNVDGFIDTSTMPSGLFIRDRFSFIPTASALDIGNNNIILTDSDYLNSYVGGAPPSAPKNSPFENYSTEFDNVNSNARNYQHITFNPRNGDWLAAELIGTNIEFTNCSDFCSNAEIIGPDIVCNSEIFNVTNEATTVNWSITEGSSLVSSTPLGNTLTLQPQNSNSKGYVTISVNYSNSTCGTASGITKRIWVGKPNVTSPGINGGSNSAGVNSISNFGVGWSQGNTLYYWTVTPNASCSAGVGPRITANNSTTYTSTSRFVSVNWGNCPETYSLTCYAKNDCGLTYIGSKFVTVSDNNPCGGINLRVSPNPNKNNGKKIDVTIQRIQEPCGDNLRTANTESDQYEVSVFDFYGEKKYQKTFKTKNISLKNLNLTKGIYALVVTDNNGDTETKKLIIE